MTAPVSRELFPDTRSRKGSLGHVGKPCLKKTATNGDEPKTFQIKREKQRDLLKWQCICLASIKH
jgi:hypothetical protein